MTGGVSPTVRGPQDVYTIIAVSYSICVYINYVTPGQAYFLDKITLMLSLYNPMQTF